MSSEPQNFSALANVLGIPPDSARPKIRLPGAGVEIRATATELYRVIARQNGMYYFGGQVVKPIQESTSSLPVLKILKPAEARSEFEKFAAFESTTARGPTPSTISEDTAKALLACDVAKQELPNVNGLINAPIPILHNGEFHLLQPGFDARTGFLVSGQPLQESTDLEQAVEMVKAVLYDFEFQTDADTSRAIAAVLTPALKFGSFIKGTIPIEIVEANDSQSGKGYLVLRRAAVYGEIPTEVTQVKGGVGSFDEKLASALVKARPFITIDNYRGELNSPYLESFRTSQGNFSARTPGMPEAYVSASSYSVAITSNGLKSTTDLANRASFIRLVKGNLADYTLIGGMRILEYIRHLQPHFLGAVCKIIRHWHSNGMPKTNESRHSFSDWASTLDWIVQNIFHLPPLLDGNDEAQVRLTKPHLSFLRQVAIKVDQEHTLDIPHSASHIVELCERHDIEIPGVSSTRQYQEDYPPKAVGKAMKQCFLDNSDELTLENYRIVRQESVNETATLNRHSVKTYTFSKVGVARRAIQTGPPRSRGNRAAP